MEFNELLNDKNCRDIGYSAVIRYGIYLNDDEKYQCYCLGLFNALSGYNGSVKFLTHVFNHCKYATQNYCKEFKAIPIKPTPEQVSSDFDSIIDVGAAMNLLTEEEKKIVQLYYYEGHSMKSGGEILGYTRSSFDRRLTKIHKKLQRSLGVFS